MFYQILFNAFVIFYLIFMFNWLVITLFNFYFEKDEPQDDESSSDDLKNKLVVGQIYRKIFCVPKMSCSGEDEYQLVWVCWHEDVNCCGYDELIAFKKEPPNCFVYGKNGTIIEVIEKSIDWSKDGVPLL